MYSSIVYSTHHPTIFILNKITTISFIYGLLFVFIDNSQLSRPWIHFILKFLGPGTHILAWLVWQQWWCQKDLSHQRCYFPHLVRKFYPIYFGLIGNKMDIKGDIDGGQEWPKDANIEAPRVLKGVIHPHFLPAEKHFSEREKWKQSFL